MSIGSIEHMMQIIWGLPMWQDTNSARVKARATDPNARDERKFKPLAWLPKIRLQCLFSSSSAKKKKQKKKKNKKMKKEEQHKKKTKTEEEEEEEGEEKEKYEEEEEETK